MTSIAGQSAGEGCPGEQKKLQTIFAVAGGVSVASGQSGGKEKVE
jgi:hypothetical protein